MTYRRHFITRCTIDSAVLTRTRLQAWADDTSKISQNVQKFQNYGTSLLYLESPWKMHSNKYKHPWYWSVKSWNSLWNFRIWRIQTNFCAWWNHCRMLSANPLSMVYVTELCSSLFQFSFFINQYLRWPTSVNNVLFLACVCVCYSNMNSHNSFIVLNSRWKIVLVQVIFIFFIIMRNLVVGTGWFRIVKYQQDL